MCMRAYLPAFFWSRGAWGTASDAKGSSLAGLLIFAIGSAYSAFSGSVTTLITARAIMGVGAACIMPATLSIITDVFRERAEQAQAIGIWSGTTGLGIAIGPIAGGWLLAHFWWGSVFLINVPVAFLGAVAALFWIPESHEAKKRPLDLFGAVLSTTGLAMLLWSIIEAPLRGWDSTAVLSAGFGALVILGAFVVWERHVSHPMLVLEAFGNRRFSIAMAAVALAVFALMGALFVLTQYLQFSLGYSALATGVRILPIAAVLAVAALVVHPPRPLAGDKSGGGVGARRGGWRLVAAHDAERIQWVFAGIGGHGASRPRGRAHHRPRDGSSHGLVAA